MGLGDLVKRAAEAVVQGALVTYYFVYYMVKGGEPEADANHPQLCIDNKTGKPAPPYNPPMNAAGSNPNVCCLHGAQAKPAPFGYSPPPPPPLQPTPRRHLEKKTQSGWLSWLNPKNWFSSSAKKPEETVNRGEHRPVAPPRHFKPIHEHMSNGTQSAEHTHEQGQSILSKLWSYVPSLGQKGENESERSSSPIATHRILRVVTIPGPGTRVPDDDGRQGRSGNFIQELKHAVEPHYPGSLDHQQHDPYRPSMVVRYGIEYAPPPTAPPPPPMGRVAPLSSATSHIHVNRPKPLAPSNVKADDAWMTAPIGGGGAAPEVQRVIWTPGNIHQQQPPQPQPHAASTVQVQTQLQQLRKTPTIGSPASPTPYEPEDSQKSVRDLKRQWPPPSNASGVEIVKDLVFPDGAPGDLGTALMADEQPTFNYDSYRSSNQTESNIRAPYEAPRVREFSGSSQNDYDSNRNYERSATSPERFRELSHELTSKSSAGKGVEMFVRRRQKVENWMNEEEEEQQPRPPVLSSVQRMVPVAAPRKRVSANEVVDSVVEAASRKEHQPRWQQPSEHPPMVFQPPRPDVSSPTRRELEQIAQPQPPTVAQQTWPRHERFFSPQPFGTVSQRAAAPERGRLFTPPPRSHEPKVQQQAYRSTSVLGDRMEQKEFIAWKTGPETTTTVISANTPSANRTLTKSTFAASRGSQYVKTSAYNTLPRTWKSYSEAYNNQNR